MFITELQQSFHGISEKIIPGAVVAVDVAATYGFSINSVTYGFVSGVIGQFIAVGIMIGISAIPGNTYSNIAIPLFITLFFNSGSLGIYANASGGW
ncbi:Ascorbate-specific PTS system EIIC component, partial [Mesomycoplasma hyorhinis]